MKRYIALLLIFCLALSLCACGVKSDADESTAPHDTTETETTVSETGSTGDDPEPADPTNSAQPTTSQDPTAGAESTSQPSAGTVISTTPGNAQSAQCSHSYQVTDTQASTCTIAGTRTYTCSKCKSGYTEALTLAEHKYAAATCEKPQTCSVCSRTAGNALGHNYGADAKCTRCSKMADPIPFQAKIRSDKQELLKGITVTVYVDNASTPAGSGTTDSKGVATVQLPLAGSSYLVVLSDVPAKYEAKESYTFSSTLVNLTLSTRPTLDPNDHSNAQYKVGNTMADFNLKDTDGNTYKLSSLLQSNDLIILDFWYVTCVPCKNEFPYFNAALDEYGDRITLLALDPIDDEAAIKKLRTELEVSFPMLRDTVNLYQGFDVTAYPTTVFIDSSGKILNIHRGDYKSEASFLNDVERYLD